MKALTVRQPYAELIVSGRKAVETRSWPTPHQGPLAIHAGIDTFPDADELCAAYSLDLDGLPRGGIVGTVELVTCRPSADLSHVSTKGWGWQQTGSALLVGTDERRCGNMHAGWLWLLRDARRCSLVPVRGNVGVWELPSELVPSRARRRSPRS